MADDQTGPTYDRAISGIESGGNYGLLGPITKSGDRAYGKYQVMGSNIGPWTQEILGVKLSPQEFLGSREAQDTVFNAKFGQYVNKYGPEGAARAWFAGPGGMNNPNAKDQLGTTVQQYADKFTHAMAPPLGMSEVGPAPPVGAITNPSGQSPAPAAAPSQTQQLQGAGGNGGAVSPQPTISPQMQQWLQMARGFRPQVNYQALAQLPFHGGFKPPSFLGI